MPHAKKPSRKKAPDLTMPQEDIRSRILNLATGVVRSNNELVPALERLRSSYQVLLAGRPVTDSEELLWQVEGALMNAERSRNALAMASLSRPEEHKHSAARRGTPVSTYVGQPNG